MLNKNSKGSTPKQDSIKAPRAAVEAAAAVAVELTEAADDKRRILMECVLEHYLKHHEAVLRKLQLAQQATIENFQEDAETNKEGDTHNIIEECQNTWEESIEDFIKAGISEDGLTQIDGVLLTIPKDIKEGYDALIKAETHLAKLISELGSDKYKEAFEEVGRIQCLPDAMSNLSQEEFKIMPASLKSNSEEEDDEDLKVYTRAGGANSLLS